MDNLINPSPVLHERKNTGRNKVRCLLVALLAALELRLCCCLQTRLVSTHETEREPIDTLEIFEVCCLFLSLVGLSS